MPQVGVAPVAGPAPSGPAPSGPGQTGGTGVPFSRPLVPNRPPLLRPRRVRGGVKLGDVEGGTNGWAAQRWARVVEMAATGDQLKEGLEYAKSGQTKRVAYLSGRIEAAVQGRADRAYSTVLRLTPFTGEQWDRVVAGLTEGAVYAAKLLAGEMPANIEDVFVPLGLKLFPTEISDVQVSCTCAEHQAASRAAQEKGEAGSGFWCKHVCCVSHLFAERLATEPFLMFLLRGVDGQDLLERLRQRRAVVSAALGSTPVYTQRVVGVSDQQAKPLNEELARFWDSNPELQQLEFPIEPPAVSHPLLRRLGPSPFQNAAFPLVGLLASCYDTISLDALRLEVSESSEDREGDAEGV